MGGWILHGWTRPSVGDENAPILPTWAPTDNPVLIRCLALSSTANRLGVDATHNSVSLSSATLDASSSSPRHASTQTRGSSAHCRHGVSSRLSCSALTSPRLSLRFYFGAVIPLTRSRRQRPKGLAREHHPLPASNSPQASIYSPCQTKPVLSRGHQHAARLVDPLPLIGTHRSRHELTRNWY